MSQLHNLYKIMQLSTQDLEMTIRKSSRLTCDPCTHAVVSLAMAQKLPDAIKGLLFGGVSCLGGLKFVTQNQLDDGLRTAFVSGSYGIKYIGSLMEDGIRISCF